MRIAIFTDTFQPQVNGIVTATLHIAEGLAKQGHKVHIIAPKHKILKEFKFKNIVVKRRFGIPAPFYTGFKLTLPFDIGLLIYLIKNKIDVVHFQTPGTLGMNAIILAKLLNLPLIGTFHTFLAHPHYLKHIKMDYQFMDNFSWSYLRGYSNRCDLITSPSNETKKELIQRGFKRPIKVISNGIDLKMFNNSNWKKVRSSYGKDARLALFVGRIAHEKNIFFLIDCFKKVVKKVPKAKLIIVGGGPQMHDLRQRIRSNRLEDNVVLLGEIKHHELLKSSIFKACDIFVTASVTENQPMTVLEAQANGLPCIGLDGGGMKDLIKDGHNGYLLSPSDSEGFSDRMIQILSDTKTRDKMSRNTLDGVKEHSLPMVIKEWEKTYAQAIKDKHKRFRRSSIRK